MTSMWGQEGQTVGEMIVAHATAAPPPAPPPPSAPPIPATGAEAATRLAELKADPKWLDAFLRGNSPEVAEFRRVSEIAQSDQKADALDKAVRGELFDGPFQPSGHLANIAAAAALKEQGLEEAVIRQALEGRPVTRAEFAAAEKAKASLMRNQSFVSQFLAGNGEQREIVTRLDIILSSPVEDAA